MHMDTNRNAEGQEGGIALTDREGGTQLMTPQLNEKDQSEKRRVSIRKVENNRKNAEKSTGPRTERGKGYSCMNAFKHGLRLNRPEAFPFKERQEELRKLYARLVDEMQPVGFLEESCVEQIAVCLWKRKRVFTYENAEIRLREENVLEEVRSLNEVSLMTESDRFVMSLLRSAKNEIESIGELSEELKERFSLLSHSFRNCGPSFKQWQRRPRKRRSENVLRR